jgi:hypothetical protein
VEISRAPPSFSNVLEASDQLTPKAMVAGNFLTSDASTKYLLGCCETLAEFSAAQRRRDIIEFNAEQIESRVSQLRLSVS